MTATPTGIPPIARDALLTALMAGLRILLAAQLIDEAIEWR